MSYRRKKDGETVEAVQYVVGTPVPEEWVVAAFNDQRLYYAPAHVGRPLMLNGETEVQPTDWIVQQADGSLIAVKAKTFARGYELEDAP